LTGRKEINRDGHHDWDVVSQVLFVAPGHELEPSLIGDVLMLAGDYTL
jgi:hypothetical protein